LPRVPGPQRSFLIRLTALAAACAVLQAITGISDLVLTLTPLFLIAALLLSGRYIGEEKIVARWHGAARRPAPRRRTQRWRPRAVLALRSMLEPGAVGVRGPPVRS
jgi:hypothetical protein